MALPVSPPPKSDDVASHGWAGITVRIAWTLLSAGVKVAPATLDAARQHALFHIPPTTSLPHAEDRAAALTRAFIAQARGRALADPWPADAEMALSERWVRAIQGIRDRASQVVFRMHYGDHRSLEQIEAKVGLDRVAAEAARAGLREVLRGTARADGVPLDTWSAERLDRVLARLAGWAPDCCPPAWDVVNGAHRAHVKSCARCNRMVRLVSTGALDASDLQAPTLKARPRGQLTLLALHFHPDGRAHRAELARAIGARTHALGDDLLLVESGATEALRQTLALAAEVAAPAREHLRGALLTGPGAWSAYGPLGPLAASAPHEVRSRAWGAVDGVGALPERLPEPPTAWNAWGAVGGLALTASLVLWFAATTAGSAPVAVDARFTPGRDGTWARFDVPEHAHVHLFGARDGRATPVLLSSSPADKGELAVGDGSYRALVPSEDVLLVSTDRPLDLERALAALPVGDPSPLPALSREILRMDPGAHVFLRGRVP